MEDASKRKTHAVMMIGLLDMVELSVFISLLNGCDYIVVIYSREYNLI